MNIYIVYDGTNNPDQTTPILKQIQQLKSPEVNISVFWINAAKNINIKNMRSSNIVIFAFFDKSSEILMYYMGMVDRRKVLAHGPYPYNNPIFHNLNISTTQSLQELLSIIKGMIE